jgi:KaiC/GvpD/RAD55 family RecA-like ATPase
MPKSSKKPPRKAFKKVMHVRPKAAQKEPAFPENIPKSLLSKDITPKDLGFGAKLDEPPAFEAPASSTVQIPDFSPTPQSSPASSAPASTGKSAPTFDADDTPTYPTPKDAIQRTPTGIKGLDALIRGGFPRSSSILVSGSAGTGKTILSLQFLVNGATMYNEKGLYISLEEDTERVKRYMNATFGWPLEELEKKKKLLFVKSDIYDFEKFKGLIESNVEKIGAQRLVIDPLTVISLFFERPLDIRRSLLDLDKLLKKLDVTTLLTVEVPEGLNSISSFGIEEFTCDGIVLLSFSFGVPRLITIRKMRATEHDTDARPFEIKYSKGIVVYPSKELFKFWKS